jgi:hypothetical protein|uniref:Uncharacterized protein n=1 Tax=viral metagenome TaxID=1070528 RepID=A0A6C0AS57_9ZZZZ
MADKSTILRAFNTHFFDFLNDIISITQDNHEICVAKTSFETIKRANPTIILKVWYKFVYMQYKEVIENGDITFFFEKDYGRDLANLNNADDIMKTIDKIRQPIKEMSDENKAHSTKYIQNLSKLSMTYMNL